MYILDLLSAGLVLASSYLLIPPAVACDTQNAPAEAFTIGNDSYADPATVGYTLNHFAVNVIDIDATMHFYGKILGMRHIFTFHASPAYEIIYMGYSHGGKNGTGFQSGNELYNEKNNIEGLIEFLYLKDCDNGTSSVPKPSTKRPNTFSHIGLIVPDIMATQSRMEQYGVNILKRAGDSVKPETPKGRDIANAFGFGSSQEEAKAALAGIKVLGFNEFLIVTDPDGNLLEIQPQVSTTA